MTGAPTLATTTAKCIRGLAMAQAAKMLAQLDGDEDQARHFADQADELEADLVELLDFAYGNKARHSRPKKVA